MVTWSGVGVDNAVRIQAREVAGAGGAEVDWIVGIPVVVCRAIKAGARRIKAEVVAGIVSVGGSIEELRQVDIGIVGEITG